MPDWFDELSEFLRIESISAEPEHAGDVERSRRSGCVTSSARPAASASSSIGTVQPLAVGEVRASSAPDDAPTVLCYGHFDVQPADPIELWESDPFEPEIRGEYLYGRGVADDKGQLYLLLSAARELARAGELPVNVRFACDGEEETGGHSIVEFLQDDERGAGAAVIFDSGMIGRGLPAFNVATRGLVYFHVTLTSGRRDLHSGLYGGAALNAPHALIRTLDSVLAGADGRLAEPLRAGILPPSEEELEGWRALPAGSDELADQGARPADAGAADEFYVRTFAEPALDVNGLESGSPHVEKTVLPVVAHANVSIRLAPGQQPDEIAAGVRGAPARGRARGRGAVDRTLVERSPRCGAARLARDQARAGGVRARARSPPGVDPLRRHPADRAGARRPRDPDDHHGLLAPGREHPLAQRAAARRIRAARHRHREGAVRGAACAVSGALVPRM